MTQGIAHIVIRCAAKRDLDSVKAIADDNRSALGFVTRATFEQLIGNEQLVVATLNRCVVGFQSYYHRKRDLQTTLYHKCVAQEHRRRKIGTLLVDEVVAQCRLLGREKVLLKCPTDLASNAFHKSYGFRYVGTVGGRKRDLNVWELAL